jgi:hypothetical protein
MNSLSEDTTRKQVVVRLFDETEGAFRYREVNGAGAYLTVIEMGLIGDV